MNTNVLEILKAGRERLSDRKNWCSNGVGTKTVGCAAATVLILPAPRQDDQDDQYSDRYSAVNLLWKAGYEIHGTKFHIGHMNDGEGAWEGKTEDERYQLVLELYDKAIAMAGEAG